MGAGRAGRAESGRRDRGAAHRVSRDERARQPEPACGRRGRSVRRRSCSICCSACAALSRDTDGAFDITSTPLSRCWGFLRREGRLPSDPRDRRARDLVGMQHVSLDAASGRRVRFRRPGIELNLGAIGKGYALDRVAATLRSAGVQHALLSAGQSSLLAIGGRGRGWTIDLVSPRRAQRDRARLAAQCRSRHQRRRRAVRRRRRPAIRSRPGSAIGLARRGHAERRRDLRERGRCRCAVDRVSRRRPRVGARGIASACPGVLVAAHAGR